MLSTTRPSSRTIRRTLAAGVTSIAVIGFAAPAALAQEPSEASVTITCTEDEGAVAIIDIVASGGELFTIEIDEVVIDSDLGAGRYEYDSIEDGTYEVGVLEQIGPDDLEVVLLETVDVDCQVDPTTTTTTTAPPSTTTTTAAPAPAAANRTAARPLSFTG